MAAEMQAEIVKLQERLFLSEQHGVKLADSIDQLRNDSDEALRNANNKIAELQHGSRQDHRGD